jgi:hypothetical protein
LRKERKYHQNTHTQKTFKSKSFKEKITEKTNKGDIPLAWRGVEMFQEKKRKKKSSQKT